MLVYEILLYIIIVSMDLYIYQTLTNRTNIISQQNYVYLLTSGEDCGAGWIARPGIIDGSDLDSVYLSTLSWRQDAGAGCGVTGEVLVTCHQILDGSIHLLVKGPGYREFGHTIAHHHRHVDRRW